MLILLSDLQLGAGDELEDFLLWGPDHPGPEPHLRVRARVEMDKLFAALLAVKLAQAKAAGIVPALVLLGNTFNLWQVQRPSESPRHALGRILGVHAEFTASLGGWLRAGGRLDLVLGPRDQPLVNARAWGMLRGVLPGINASLGGRPVHAWSSEEHGLYALPGGQHDPFFRLRNRQRPSATCIGREFLRRVTTVFEPVLPWIDKASTISGMVRLAQAGLPPALRREAFDRLASAVRWPSWLLHTLDPWRRGAMADWTAIRAREQATRKRAMRRLSCEAGTWRWLATPPAPGDPRRRQPSRGPEILSPGPWHPVLQEDGIHTPRMHQPMGYVQLVPDGAGAWEASVHDWALECGHLNPAEE